jgi:hypothetical protein
MHIYKLCLDASKREKSTNTTQNAKNTAFYCKQLLSVYVVVATGCSHQHAVALNIILRHEEALLLHYCLGVLYAIRTLHTSDSMPQMLYRIAFCSDASV